MTKQVVRQAERQARANADREDLAVIPESTDLQVVAENLHAAEAEKGELTPCEKMHIVHRRFTPERAAAIIENVRRGASQKVAAEATGIHEQTFYNWIKLGKKGEEGYAEFLAGIQQARAQSEIDSIQIVDDAAHNGQWTAAAWKLERKYPERWAKKERVDHGSSEPIKIKLSW